MTLSEKDGQLFYKLWLPFLDYVNEKCKVNKNVKDMAKQFKDVYMSAKKSGTLIKSL